LLYYIHPALRSYLQNISDKNLEVEYGDAFSRYYLNLLSDTYSAWGKENHVPSIARFKIIAESEDNDFDRAIKLLLSVTQPTGIFVICLLVSKFCGVNVVL
jgi:hypothetical protein